MKKTILLIFLLMAFPAWGIIEQADTENADRDITSVITVLTDTPDGSNPAVCQGLIYLGDGAKDLDGSGGLFELTITVGGQTVMPSPQEVQFSTAGQAAVWTSQFPVPAGAAVILRVKSPNAADSDVDVTAYLFIVSAVNMIAISGDLTAADNLESTYDGTGYADDVAPSTQLQITTVAGGIAVSTAATGITISDPGGGEQTLTYTVTASHDNSYHEVASDDEGNDIDFYYTFNTGDGMNLPVSFHFHGYYEDNNGAPSSMMVIQSYDFNTAGWETIYTLTDSASDILLELPLHAHDVDPDGGNEGDVLIRFNLFYAPEVNQNVRIDHVTVGYVTGGLTAAAVVNEWETQSQADPTGFHVNLLEVEGTDATTYIESFMPAPYHPDASSTITTGNQDGGTYESCAIDDGMRWVIGDEDGTDTIDVICEFDVGADRVATVLTTNGYFKQIGGGGPYVVEVYAFNFTLGEYEKISSDNAEFQLESHSSDLDYVWTLKREHTDPYSSPGCVLINFRSTRQTTADGDILRLDHVQISGVADGTTDLGAIYMLDTILVDTDELQTDWTNSGRLDLILDAVKAYWDSLTITGGLLEVVPGSI